MHPPDGVTHATVIENVLTSGAAISGILVGILGLLYAVFGQFAQPRPDGSRLPVVPRLKTLARWTFVALVLSSAVVLLSVAWLLSPNDVLYYLAIASFVGDIVLLLGISAVVVFRLFK